MASIVFPGLTFYSSALLTLAGDTVQIDTSLRQRLGVGLSLDPQSGVLVFVGIQFV
jgi:hypothetical protein